MSPTITVVRPPLPPTRATLRARFAAHKYVSFTLAELLAPMVCEDMPAAVVHAVVARCHAELRHLVARGEVGVVDTADGQVFHHTRIIEVRLAPVDSRCAASLHDVDYAS